MASTIRKSEYTVKTITSNLVEKGIIIRRNGWWEINLSNFGCNDLHTAQAIN